MTRKTDHFTESELRKALRLVSHQNEQGGGDMILQDSENIRRLREACRLRPHMSVVEVANEIVAGFEVL